ncbi:MAG: outer membrane lipoprotein-sorting protein [Candidatus Brocadiia bacterium]
MAAHLARFDAMESLLLQVERQTTTRGQSRAERWTFRKKGRRRVRIDVHFPVRRLVVVNESDLWEYIPDARRAAHTDLRPLSEEQRRAALANVLRPVAIEGLRFEGGGPEAELRYLGTRRLGPRPTHCIECVPADEGGGQRVRGWIDAQRHVLLRCEFLDDTGQVLAVSEASRVAEVAPGTWWPHRLTMTLLTSRGARQRVTFTRVSIGEAMPDSLFRFAAPEDAEVVEH